MKYATILAALLVGGCASAPARVIVRGEPVAIQALAGDWEGSFWSHSSDDRKGTLAFALAAGSDSAYGDVTMLAPQGQMIFSADTKMEHSQHAKMPQSLHIEFVRVANGSIEGRLESYIAPDCICAVETTFSGTLAGDTMRGNYVSRSSWTKTQEGQWQMQRKAPVRVLSADEKH